MNGRMVLGAAAGVTAAVVWALSIAIYQPFMQPSGFWTDSDTGQSYPQLGQNNTYWPRDIRELAILLGAVGVVLISRARARGAVTGAIGAAVWLAADVVLDRLDVAGRPAAVWLAVIGVLWFAVVAIVAAVACAGREESTAVRHVTAVVAAVLAAALPLVTTPWDEPVTDAAQVRVEDALSTMKIALMVAFVVTALGLVAFRPAATRAGRVAICAGVAGLAIWHATTTDGLPSIALLLAAAPLVVIAAAWEASLPRLGVVAVALACALSTIGLLIYVVGMAVGSALTSLAGNPPINSADEDVSLGFVGLAAGLLAAAISYLVIRPRTQPVPHLPGNPDPGQLGPSHPAAATG